MNILQVVDHYNDGGGKERFIYDFSKKLIDNKFKTTIACFESEDIDQWGESSDIKVIHLSNKLDILKESVKNLQPDAIIWHVGHLTMELIYEISDEIPVFSIVHNVTCPSGTRLLRVNDEICNKCTGNSCLINWYTKKCGTSKSPIFAIKQINNSKRLHVILKKSKTVYVASEAMKRVLELEKIPSEKIELFDITLGSLKDLQPIKELLNSKHLNILYVGRLSYTKGVQYLIKAIELLNNQKVKVNCTIVGSGWYQKELELIVKEKNLTDIVLFTGQVKGTDLMDWYKKSDMVVVPSIWLEAAGLVVPEARKQGKPVIVTGSGGLGEWSNMMNNIYIANHSDAESLAETIIRVKNVAKPTMNNEFKTPFSDLVESMVGNVKSYMKSTI